jgi:hypothetical protein
MDSDPAIFIVDLQDANKNYFFLSFSAYYFLMVQVHNFSETKSHKIVGIKVFLAIYADDKSIRIRTSD